MFQLEMEDGFGRIGEKIDQIESALRRGAAGLSDAGYPSEKVARAVLDALARRQQRGPGGDDEGF